MKKIKLLEKYKILFIILLLLVFIIIYYILDPYKFNFFPKCPFYVFTGYKCVGCGSQRAIHYLLNFDIRNAIEENLLVVFFSPYLLIGAICEIKQEKSRFWNILYKKLYTETATWIILVIILVFWSYRFVIA